tara:strand:- start:1191 stop:1397 length:207 start_codon:yes stop_codon:yes gene_type:complete
MQKKEADVKIGDLVAILDDAFDIVTIEQAVTGTVIFKDDHTVPAYLEVLVKGKIWEAYSDGVVVINHT